MKLLRNLLFVGDMAAIRRILSTTTGLVFSADQDGYIPLICASMEGGFIFFSITSLDMYYNLFVSVNFSIKGHMDAAALLLNIGGNVHHETKYGYTALSHACANGHTDTAVMLIDRGFKTLD